MRDEPCDRAAVAPPGVDGWPFARRAERGELDGVGDVGAVRPRSARDGHDGPSPPDDVPPGTAQQKHHDGADQTGDDDDREHELEDLFHASTVRRGARRDEWQS
ncbi:hypothetical protein ACFT5B_13590 [Luteimicrobium sp. NPDC057192]|uniref:hypothetical protein n=1 Tax=Luteimicrobium sp. NPDC057192 TaxID=3346042 RepID=UPI0036320752